MFEQQALEEFQLLDIFFGITLPLDIPFYHLPVGALANRRNVIPIRPKFSPPELALDAWLPSEDLSSSKTLEYLHNPPWRYFWMSTTEYMKVILIRAKSFQFNRIPFFNTYCGLFNNLCDGLV